MSTIVDVVVTDPPLPDIGEARVDTGLAFQLKRQRTSCAHSAFGKRDEAVITPFRGKYSHARLPRSHSADIALDATLRAAAGRLSGAASRTLRVQPQDLREKIRRHRSPYVIAFVVDNSWSMHVETTLEQTKGVVLELLKDARIYHDKVAIVAFRHNRVPDAAVCLPLTNSYTLAAERLRKIPLSGTTPLPDGISKAYGLLRQERNKYHNAIPVMVIISDGLPNIPLKRGGDPYRDIGMLCRHLRRDGISTVIVDTEATGSGGGKSNCREMASLSHGTYLPLSLLTRESIEKALRPKEIAEAPPRRKQTVP